MTTPLPPDRLSIRRRAMAIVLGGVVALVASALILTRTADGLDKGWVGAIPDPLQQVAGVLLLLLGLGFVVPSLVWMLVPLRGPRPPVVHFEPTRILVRGSVAPRTFVVERDAVVGVHVAHIQKWGQDCGLWPLVVVRTKDGRGRGIQNLYDGDPDELAQDIARWASVPLTEPRRVLVFDEEFKGWDA